MKIAVKQLRALGACAEQVEMFECLFGASVEVTEALCVKHAQDFGVGAWDWAAGHLLSPSALAEYDAATAPARATYEAARAPARAEYDAARATAWATYEAATATTWAEYDAARAPAWATYKAAVARAFGRAAAA